MKRIRIAALGLLLAAGNAQAGTDIDFLTYMAGTVGAQEKFKLLSEDIGSAIAYRAIAPGEPLGTTGFDLGVEIVATNMQFADDWVEAVAGATATSSDTLDTLVMPRLHVHKGLPFGIDIGAFYVGSSNSNIEVTGAELRYAFLEGSVATPAIGIRGSYSKLSGVDELEMSTKGLELTISKGFTIFTPYASAGQVWIDSSLAGDASGLLEDEKISATRVAVGVNMNFGLVNFVVDADKTGETTSYALKLGFRW